jgi:hypothetical protein
MTFGMMFGSQQNSMDEWSTDDDGEYDEEDEDGDFLGDDYYDEYPALTTAAGIEAWEHGSDASRSRGSSDAKELNKDHSVAEDERRLRLARKRAEKKKKQKEKKTKESMGKMEDMIPVQRPSNHNNTTNSSSSMSSSSANIVVSASSSGFKLEGNNAENVERLMATQKDGLKAEFLRALREL